jgi:hypothetical protein
MNERTNAIGGEVPLVELFRDNYDALVQTKAWIDDSYASFRNPASTNIPPDPLTRTGLLVMSGAPADFLDATSQRGMAEQWQYIPSIFTNLWLTWAYGSSCAATSGAACGQSTNDTGYMYNRVIDLSRSMSACDAARWYWSYTNGGVDWQDLVDGVLEVQQIRWQLFGGSETYGCRLPYGMITVDSVTQGDDTNLYTMIGQVRYSAPIAYAIPQTNVEVSMVEYLAAGVPTNGLTYRDEGLTSALGSTLSNGAWVMWASNPPSIYSVCNSTFVNTNAPLGAACATNVGWAITNAGAKLFWQFKYR